ncbi:MAG: folylpolyglutamate synthase/dihydrofolate synthase family protein [Planctomycetota bacterium]
MPASSTKKKTKRSTAAKSSPTKRRSAPAKSTPKLPPITNYTTATKWLFDLADHEKQRLVKYDDKSFNLNRMRKLLKQLGDPQDQLKCVQIVGTKGKGSTCAMLASTLDACGYTVGLFTSPHLIDLRERITINGSLISYPDAADVIKQVATASAAMRGEGPTFFEALTAAALLYFADQAVDIAVLETGLGGRLDSVSAITPLLIGMTQISLDHTHLLGDTVQEIAAEKAGAFKPDVPVISVQQEKPVVQVLKEKAEETGCPIQFTGPDIDFSYRFEANRELGPHTRVCLTTPRSKYEHLAVPLKGEHQALNCGLALALLDGLKQFDFVAEEGDVMRGLAQTELHGRLEQVHDTPRVLIDGAHNPASLQGLIKSLGAHYQYDSLVMIFGCAADKQVDAMLKQVSLGADKVIFTKARTSPRALEADDLMRKFGDLSGKMAQKCTTLEQALRTAARAVSREDLIIVTGSFYLAGEARKFFIDAKAKQAKAS